MKTPVLIAARNEEQYIGTTLGTLARQSHEVSPYVVVNGSTDRTADIAKGTGAIVLESEAGKMCAIQAGLSYLGKAALEPVMILDADSRPRSKHWSRRMTGELKALPLDRPGIIWGPYIFSEEINPLLGAIFTATSMRVSWADRHDNDPRTVRGGNMGLKLLNANLLEDLLELDNYWPREDVAIHDTVMAHGANSKVSFHPDAWVETSGYRIMQTIKGLMSSPFKPTKATDKTYDNETIAGTRPYNSPHTRHKNKNPNLK